MKKVFGLLLACATLALTACGGETTYYNTPHVVEYTPELRSFDIVDSYGVDTGKPGTTPLALNPDRYNGLFDVYWRVNSLEDYRVNIRINDAASTNNSFLIHSETCGFGRACDQDGGVICEYTTDFYLSCNNNKHPTDINTLFKKVPQKLYLILQVCDLNSPFCTFQYYPVYME